MVHYTFKCLCGETAGTIDSEKAKVKAICHCNDCRSVTSGGVAVEIVALSPEDVKLTKESELKEYKLKDTVTRYFCGACGTKMYNSNKFGLYVLATEIIEDDKGEDLKPALHLCYSERKYDVKDDLPKFLDFPEPFGGTGKMAEE